MKKLCVALAWLALVLAFSSCKAVSPTAPEVIVATITPQTTNFPAVTYDLTGAVGDTISIIGDVYLPSSDVKPNFVIQPEKTDSLVKPISLSSVSQHDNAWFVSIKFVITRATVGEHLLVYSLNSKAYLLVGRLTTNSK